MSSLITLDSLSAATPDGHLLFSNLTLAVGRERLGVVGRNGSGKSTLLRIIAGEVAAAAGSASTAGRVGAFQQVWSDEIVTVADALGVTAQIERLRRLEVGAGDVDDAGDADWMLEARIGEAMAQAGLPLVNLDRRLTEFSGGERTRISVARALLDSPHVLLLDEPTNNLDAEGRAAVARLIAAWRGAVLVASHDRALLEDMDRIVELTQVGCRVFGGRWSAFHAAREAERTQAQTHLERTEDAVRQTERAVQRQREKKARRDKAGRAWRAKGADNKMFLDAEKQRAEQSGARDGRLADRLLADAVADHREAKTRVEILTPLRIDLPSTGLPSGRELLRFDAVSFARDGRVIVPPLSFAIRGPERVSLTGPNGSGKTTVLNLAVGAETPASGRIDRANEGFALLDQQVALLDAGVSILANLRRLNPNLSDNDAHTALACFAFRNHAASQIVGTLSGGERLRAGLACVLSAPRPPQLLLLDEPTNHLDLYSIEILEASLASFDGALLVASHDTAFLDAIAIDRNIAL